MASRIDLSDREDGRLDLLRSVSSVRGEALRLVRRRAVLRWVTLVLVTAAVVVALDVWLRREEIGLRFLGCFAFLGAAAFGVYQWLWKAWKFQPSNQEVANWISQSDLEHRNELATAVQLSTLSPDDSRYGSLAMRRLALEKWFQQSAEPELISLLDYRPFKAALVASLVTCAVLIGLVCYAPRRSALGVARLAMPWSAMEWPREDKLQFLDLPTAVAFGSDLQLEVVDAQSPKPASIEVLTRELRGESGVRWSSERRYLASGMGRVAVATIPSVERTLEVRAVGGDDQKMEWRRIEVVRPPDIMDHQFSIQPPNYTGSSKIETDAYRIAVLAGSQVTLEGTFSAPVASLKLQAAARSDVGSTQSESNGNGSPASETLAEATPCLTLFGEGRRFRIESIEGGVWQAASSLDFRMQVLTDGGLAVLLPKLWSVDVRPDQKPVVRVARLPLTTLAASAIVSVSAEATDDLGLVRVEMQGRFLGQESGPELPRVEQGTSTRSSEFGSERGSRIAEFSQVVWKREGAGDQAQRRVPVVVQKVVSDLVGMGGAIEEGQELELWIEALDTAGQVGRSTSQRLRIRSRQDVLQAIEAKERNVWQKFQESLQAQKQNLRSAKRVVQAVEASQRVRAEDAAALGVMTQVQNSIANQITDPESGVLAEARELQDLYEQNRLQDSTQAAGALELLQALESLAARALPESVRSSLAANRSVNLDLGQGDTGTASASTQEDLREMQDAFGETVEEMQAIQGSQSASASNRETQGKLAAILNNQQSLLNQAQEFQLDALEGLGPVDTKRRSAALSADQLALAEEALEVLQDAIATATESSTSLNAEIAQGLRESGLSDRMRLAAESLAEERTDVAMERQREAIAILQGALQSSDPAASPPNQRLSRQTQQLSEAARQLSSLADQQQRLAEKIASTTNRNLEAMRSQQEKLAAEADRTTQESRGTMDAETESLLDQALQNQLDAAAALANEDQPGATDSAARAARDFQSAAEEAEQRANELMEQLQQETRGQAAYRLEEELRQMVGAQNAIMDGIEELVERAVLGASERELAEGLASRQGTVRQRIDYVIDGSEMLEEELPGFTWVLQTIAAEMARSEAALQRFRIEPEAQSAASAALTKLKLAATALRENNERQGERAAAEPGEGPDDRPSEASESERKVPPLASLKLLRGLQVDLNERTAKAGGGDRDAAWKLRQLEALSVQQKELALQLESILETNPSDSSEDK
ncbi:MAG: hypothetical protein AB8B50_10120 [Pirellulaceae bacterium]